VRLSIRFCAPAIPLYVQELQAIGHMCHAQVGTCDAQLSFVLVRFVLVLAHKHAECVEGIYVKILQNTRIEIARLCAVSAYFSYHAEKYSPAHVTFEA